MKPVYIRSSCCLSPQQTYSDAFFEQPFTIISSNRLYIAELPMPSQSKYMRLPRILKMGLSAATAALDRANLKIPDAIIVGTGYGCAETTFQLLKNGMSPKAFIFSTANSVAGQIALSLAAAGYNNTFCHSGTAFESAVLDAILLLNEGDAQDVLVGGIDEMSDWSFRSETNAGRYKNNPDKNSDLFGTSTSGTIAGEGAAFFILSAAPGDRCQAVLERIATYNQPEDLQAMIVRFLAEAEVTPADLDLVISGRNGDSAGDKAYITLENTLFDRDKILYFKQLCGEYPVATSFAMWLGTAIVQQQRLPAGFGRAGKPGSFQRVLICNSYQNRYWTLILLSNLQVLPG